MRDHVARIEMADIANVYLSLASTPENVLLVRQALAGVAEVAGLDAIHQADVSTAVSEACNNVVAHAYEGGPGPLEVEVFIRAPGLSVIVRDRGIGVRPRVDLAEVRSGGIGLPVMLALARSVEFSDLAERGTEVRLDFAGDGVDPAGWRVAARERPVQALGEEVGEGAIAVSLAPAAVARAVLPRVLCVAAARARFSTDGISDALRVADALVTQTESSLSTSHLEVAIDVAPRELGLRVGPLRPGAASRPDATGLASSSLVEMLAQIGEPSRDGAGQTLLLRLTARP